MKEPLRPITIGTLAGFSETEQAATLLQNGAKKIGIEIKIESAPWPVVQSRMQDRDKNYDMVPLWKSTYYVDPNNWVGETVRLALHRHAQHLVHQGSRAGQVDRRGAGDQRSGEAARALREGGDQGDRAGDAASSSTTRKWYGPYAANVGGIRFSPIGSGQDMRWAYYK